VPRSRAGDNARCLVRRSLIERFTIAAGRCPKASGRRYDRWRAHSLPRRSRRRSRQRCWVDSQRGEWRARACDTRPSDDANSPPRAGSCASHSLAPRAQRSRTPRADLGSSRHPRRRRANQRGLRWARGRRHNRCDHADQPLVDVVPPTRWSERLHRGRRVVPDDRGHVAAACHEAMRSRYADSGRLRRRPQATVSLVVTRIVAVPRVSDCTKTRRTRADRRSCATWRHGSAGRADPSWKRSSGSRAARAALHATSSRLTRPCPGATR
jgi:hypothetical protein